MEGEIRRQEILTILHEHPQPVSGTELAGKLGVSRQVIVQDIALLRATDKNILSTNKGYVLFAEKDSARRKKRIFKVRHKNTEIKDELYCIVDFGGRLRDVVVEHDIYGQIAADLIINSRADADAFVNKVEENKARPLNDLTGGVHFHTVLAESEEILDEIEKELNRKGYLIN